MTVEVLRKVGFTEGNVDLCLYMEKSIKGVVCIALYIDNNLIIGNPKTIAEMSE